MKTTNNDINSQHLKDLCLGGVVGGAQLAYIRDVLILHSTFKSAKA
jgi:hypothetical protein